VESGMKRRAAVDAFLRKLGIELPIHHVHLPKLHAAICLETAQHAGDTAGVDAIANHRVCGSRPGAKDTLIRSQSE
jgi:hypothetical protein